MSWLCRPTIWLVMSIIKFLWRYVTQIWETWCLHILTKSTERWLLENDNQEQWTRCMLRQVNKSPWKESNVLHKEGQVTVLRQHYYHNQHLTYVAPNPKTVSRLVLQVSLPIHWSQVICREECTWSYNFIAHQGALISEVWWCVKSVQIRRLTAAKVRYGRRSRSSCWARLYFRCKPRFIVPAALLTIIFEGSWYLFCDLHRITMFSNQGHLWIFLLRNRFILVILHHTATELIFPSISKVAKFASKYKVCNNVRLLRKAFHAGWIFTMTSLECHHQTNCFATAGSWPKL